MRPIIFAITLLLASLPLTAYADTLAGEAPDQQVFDLPPDDEIPLKYLEEMNKTYEECMGHEFSVPLRDCKCYSLRFLEERWDNPYATYSEIQNRISNSCYDLENMTKHFYMRCYNSRRITERNPGAGAACACVGRTVAQKLILMDRIRSHTTNSLFSDALVECDALAGY